MREKEPRLAGAELPPEKQPEENRVERPATEETVPQQAAPGRNDPTAGVDSLWKMLRRNLTAGRVFRQLGKMFAVWRRQGFEAFCREVSFRWRLATHGDIWRYRADIPLKKELRAQRKAVFGEMPLVSVVVPLYNTPPAFLREMIESVRRQSYANFELVLVDASDHGHPEVQRMTAQYEKKDARIRSMRLFKNKGIADNTNIGLAESRGEYITLLDHDDVLQPNALFEAVAAINEQGAQLVYSDEAVLNEDLTRLVEFHFKPDYAPDTLCGCNYITHLCVFSRALLARAGGGENSAYNGAQDYDLFLRLCENAGKIVHIPKVLYFWRGHSGSTASGIDKKEYAVTAGAKAVQAHLERRELPGAVEPQVAYPGSYRVRYAVWGNPLVSILIPSKDHIDDLERCLESLYAKAGYANFEVLVLDNNSTDPATETFYEQAEEKYRNLQVLRYPGVFNFAAICNFGAVRAKGTHLLFLNNDTEWISDGFVPEMLSYSQRADVGAVGAKLYYPDATVQHAGLIIGIGGTAGVSHKGHEKGNAGNLFRLVTVQDMSAVTGAALMVKKALYDAVGGMDEESFAVAFNDVDLCLRLRAQGLWNIFTPFAEAWHYESKSRGYDTEGPAKERFDKEAAAFRKKYAGLLVAGDPFYNPHFTLKTENFAYA